MSFTAWGGETLVCTTVSKVNELAHGAFCHHRVLWQAAGCMRLRRLMCYFEKHVKRNSSTVCLWIFLLRQSIADLNKKMLQ